MITLRNPQPKEILLIFLNSRLSKLGDQPDQEKIRKFAKRKTFCAICNRTSISISSIKIKNSYILT